MLSIAIEAIKSNMAARSSTLFAAPRLVMLMLTTPTMVAASSSCDDSDAALQHERDVICSSFGDTGPRCRHPNGTAAKGDWPNQAVYVHALLDALAAPTTCLNTSFAADTVRWLDEYEASLNGTSFAWTWLVFQAQYYDTPRKPGVRIEAPDTLGRKCWAASYLAQAWRDDSQRQRVLGRLNASGLSMPRLISMYDGAIPSSLQLCRKVLANCFVNASYDPSRNGTCHAKAAAFRYLGFERENALRGFVVRYPFW